MNDSGEAGQGDDVESIGHLIRALADARHRATNEEVNRLRGFFGDAVLPRVPGSYAREKYERHVIENEEWPPGTSLDEYARSLRSAVHHSEASVRLYYDPAYEAWSIMFVAPSGAWEGPEGFPFIVVLFNAERGWWVTGFQPEDGLRYASRRGGFWLWRRR